MTDEPEYEPAPPTDPNPAPGDSGPLVPPFELSPYDTTARREDATDLPEPRSAQPPPAGEPAAAGPATDDPALAPPPGEDPALEPAPAGDPALEPPPAPTPTIAGRVWVALGVAVLLLILLIIFIAENSRDVKISFLGAHVHFPLALSLLVAAVVGALIAFLIGTTRIIQLRREVRAHRRRAARLAAEDQTPV